MTHVPMSTHSSADSSPVHRSTLDQFVDLAGVLAGQGWAVELRPTHATGHELVIRPSASTRYTNTPRPLSPRQREVVTLIQQGLTSQEIAQRLGLSIHTISVCRSRARRRLALPRNIDLRDVVMEGSPEI